jgi:hypothetical protein
MRVSANSGRSRLLPPSAEPKTWAIATLVKDEATYGRSFTYCPMPPMPAIGRPRTRPTGSISSSSAAVQHWGVATG